MSSNIPTKYRKLDFNKIDIRILKILESIQNPYKFYDKEKELIYITDKTYEKLRRSKKNKEILEKANKGIENIGDLEKLTLEKRIEDFWVMIKSKEKELIRYKTYLEYKIKTYNTSGLLIEKYEKIKKQKFFLSEEEMLGFNDFEIELKERIEKREKIKEMPNIEEVYKNVLEDITNYMTYEREIRKLIINHIINRLEYLINNPEDNITEIKQIDSLISHYGLKKAINELKKIEKLKNSIIAEPSKLLEKFIDFQKKQIFNKNMFNKLEEKELLYYCKSIMNEEIKVSKENYISALRYMLYIKGDKREYFEIAKEKYPEIDLLKEIETQSFLTLEDKDKQLKMRKMLKEYSKSKNEKWVISIDLEFKEKNGKIEIYELGYTMKNSKEKRLIVKNFIISDTMKVNYKPFNYGVQVTKTLEEAIEELQKDLKRAETKGYILTGNGIDFDMYALRKKGLKYKRGVQIFDLSDMLSYIDKNKTKISLEKLALLCNIETKNLHNAGNDTKYSVDIFNKLLNVIEGNSQSKIIKDSLKLKLTYQEKKDNYTKTNKIFKMEDRKFKQIYNLIENRKDRETPKISTLYELNKTEFIKAENLLKLIKNNKLEKYFQSELAVEHEEEIYIELNKMIKILIELKKANIKFKTEDIIETNLLKILDSSDIILKKLCVPKNKNQENKNKETKKISKT